MAKANLPRDALPYTDEFQELKREYEQKHCPISDRDFWRILVDVGKHGGFGTKRKKRAPGAPKLTLEEQLQVIYLLGGETGRRDHLPYTGRFDQLHERFGSQTGKQLNKRDFWRVLSRVAKLSRKPQPLFEAAPLGGLPSDLVQVVERMNPWWRGEAVATPERFRRWAFHELDRRLLSRIAPVIAIRGPRQVGKTTIQLQFIETLRLLRSVAPQRILRVQFDDLPPMGALRLPVEAIVRWYEEHVLKSSINAYAQRGERVYLFFDELQNLPAWSAQLKALADHVDAHIIVTGSSALRIARGRDSLAGRLSVIELGPLRVWEIAGICKMGDLKPMTGRPDDWRRREFWLDLVAHAQRHRKVLSRAFRRFSQLGGYPRCHATPNPDRGLLAEQIVDTVVTRTIEMDVAQKHLSVDQRLLRECFRLVCRYAGQAVKSLRIAREISDTLQSAVPAAQVDEAIQFFSDSMLLHKVAPLELLLKKQPNPPKLCLCDHFVRSAFLQEVVPLAVEDLSGVNEATLSVAGHMAESVVGYFLQGIPGLDVSWYPARPDDPEVDFVLTIGTQRIPLEVKYRRRLGETNLSAFCEKRHHEAPFGIVISQTAEGPLVGANLAVPLPAFLLVA